MPRSTPRDSRGLKSSQPCSEEQPEAQVGGADINTGQANQEQGTEARRTDTVLKGQDEVWGGQNNVVLDVFNTGEFIH